MSGALMSFTVNYSIWLPLTVFEHRLSHCTQQLRKGLGMRNYTIFSISASRKIELFIENRYRIGVGMINSCVSSAKLTSRVMTLRKYLKLMLCRVTEMFRKIFDLIKVIFVVTCLYQSGTRPPRVWCVCRTRSVTVPVCPSRPDVAQLSCKM